MRSWYKLLVCIALSGCINEPASVGTIAQTNPPLPWRELSPPEQQAFDLGYAVFNTQWEAANPNAGRRSGLGPLFNSSGCDTCHNSRRRGRGPRGDGEAPLDLVMQLGIRNADNSVTRGTHAYGFVLNTSAIDGFKPEAKISIHYRSRMERFHDGTEIELHAPDYQIDNLSGSELPSTTVLMPRMPPSAQGSGLLELVPQAELEGLSTHSRHGVTGTVSWINTAEGRVAGRFGWQATEPTVASQTAAAFSREMGLTTPLIGSIDCGALTAVCDAAPSGGNPEVAADLFAAVVFFEQLHAVPVVASTSAKEGERLFAKAACTSCHVPALDIAVGKTQRQIHPYTDLLLHDLGVELADRDLQSKATPSKWRTAPLWGLSAAAASKQPLRLLHDGRARSIEEAILWHGGEATNAKNQFLKFNAEERASLVTWISAL